MSVIRVGSTGKYADGWEQIFGGSRGGRSGKPAPQAKPKAKATKATATKATAKKAAKKKAAAPKAAKKKAKAGKR